VVKSKGTSGAGLATVYRTIELFQKVGLVLRLPMGNFPARYEFIGPSVPGHHHLICLECGRVEEINDQLVSEFRKRILRKIGFSMAGMPIRVYGRCRECKETMMDAK
jgi:Fur family ferric uptake transcriptional regulator